MGICNQRKLNSLYFLEKLQENLDAYTIKERINNESSKLIKVLKNEIYDYYINDTCYADNVLNKVSWANEGPFYGRQGAKLNHQRRVNYSFGCTTGKDV